MDELGSSNLQIVLSIKEGKGFEQISQPTILIATLNGHSLESDIIEPNSNPQYATDLVWETDKTSLRKMRSGQTPLKLECFALKDHNNKEKIGYILLSIRSAQIILKSKEIGIKVNWHTLLGLRNDLKAQKPELLLSLSIEDREYVTSNSLTKKFTEIDMHRNPAGDFEKYTCERIISDHKNLAMHPTNCDMQENSIPVISQLPNSTDYSKSVEAYHCYCLDIILVAIKLSSGPAIQNIEFRFHHPKAEIMSTLHSKMSVLLGEKVILRDIGCKLHFISTTDEIKQLLVSFPPKISIYGMGEDVKTCIAQFSLDIKQLFHHDKWKYEYEMPLYNSEEIKVGELNIVVSLLDHGPYYRIKQNVSDQNFGPPIIDDSLAYKIVDELETWKERQKEIFRVELKKKEERHLNLLSEEWQRQKENLESKLACSVEQCKMLANNLNKATDDLRTRRLKNLEKEARLIKANEDLHWRYEAKIQELKESLRIMQEESTSKIRIFEEKNASLEARIEPLSIENEKLRQMITKQAEELEVYQKGSLTQDQTATLLQELKTLEEKYNNAQHNKTFFKEEWGKAVREIHRMKREHQQTIEIQIKNSKEELKNLGLEEILCADSTALTNDQILLGQIQKEIDVFKPSSLMKEKHQQILTPITEIFSKNSQTNIKTILHKPEEHDERLQALIEERDSLLKTGSYTNDDTVIVKLNTEIRNLLMNS
ncbi:centrosomal protein of 120 kDa isoform X2 [Vespula pensylvanica]|uniref:centrosomal protein of 120 kDa isoform X2 n=1 Tax=Vespula pensylvanica TaxID=30213 RepID=UPI001CBA4143|nr:centrosomal protein of 120 kDa isoform X2 [Vespula pensylvanica]